MEAREDGRSMEEARGGGSEGVRVGTNGVTISVAIVGWKLVAVVDRERNTG